MATRVLEIIPSLDRSGAEKQLTLLATQLPRDEFDVHVGVLTRGGPLLQPLEEAEIPVEMIGKSWKVDPSAYLKLKRYIKKLKPDIVHTWIFAANCYGRYAALSAGVKNIVGGERCVDPWKVEYELMIDRYLARKSKTIVTNSSGVKDFYVGKGIAEDKFTIIPNGIDVPNCDTPIDNETQQRRRDPVRAALLEELGLPDETRLIGSVSRLWPQKRIKDAIWAIDLIHCIREDTHLLIIGDGPQRERLEKYSEQCQIASHVHFLGHRDDASQIISLLDCLWLASGYEGQSNAVMEAMASSVPVIASDIPGNRDLVLSGKTGYLVTLGDRAAFAKWSKLILEDPALASDLGQAGRQRMIDEFSVKKMVDRHAELYHSLVQE